ncbi:hypothetical protein JZ751_002462 [Albula glossodonta]|uniref:Uncharacterized protein n=1 Tax=Albula glossodonta TaxID=121402 RepID=A0A8T2N6X5_9TELE|nr:hypothetical protein JZ751_002462 [Albula glossodonta]
MARTEGTLTASSSNVIGSVRLVNHVNQRSHVFGPSPRSRQGGCSGEVKHSFCVEIVDPAIGGSSPGRAVPSLVLIGKCHWSLTTTLRPEASKNKLAL